MLSEEAVPYYNSSTCFSQIPNVLQIQIIFKKRFFLSLLYAHLYFCLSLAMDRQMTALRVSGALFPQLHLLHSIKQNSFCICLCVSDNICICSSEMHTMPESAIGRKCVWRSSL